MPTAIANRAASVHRLTRACEAAARSETDLALAAGLNEVLAAAAVVLNEGGVEWTPASAKHVVRGTDGMAESTKELIHYLVNVARLPWISTDEVGEAFA